MLLANQHKERVVHPNGYVSFKELHAGERLELPEKWFNGELDQMPNSYFASLPRHDGVTPGVGQSHQSAVDVIGAAQAVASAIAADPDYCASVAKVGSAVNSAVHEFKVAWNANSPGSPVPIGTGNLEPEVSAALATALGDKAPAACGQPLQEPETRGLSTGAVGGIGLLAAVTVGGITFAVTRKPRRRRRR